MSRTPAGMIIVLAAAVLALPGALAAQNFTIQKFNIGAANRVMFVMNRMDLLDPKNLISAEAFRGYFRKNFVEVVEGARLRADRIYFGSALWVELECMRDRTVDDLWGHCKTCYYASVCKAGCTWTTHTLLGRPGNSGGGPAHHR